MPLSSYIYIYFATIYMYTYIYIIILLWFDGKQCWVETFTGTFIDFAFPWFYVQTPSSMYTSQFSGTQHLKPFLPQETAWLRGQKNKILPLLGIRGTIRARELDSANCMVPDFWILREWFKNNDTQYSYTSYVSDHVLNVLFI